MTKLVTKSTKLAGRSSFFRRKKTKQRPIKTETQCAIEQIRLVHSAQKFRQLRSLHAEINDMSGDNFDLISKNYFVFKFLWQ